MNDNQKRGLILTVSLIVAIILIVYLNIMIFISGPHIYDDNTDEIGTAVKNTLNASEINLYNKYTLDEEVYVFEAKVDGKDILVFFADNKIYEQLDISSFNIAKIQEHIDNNYNDEYDILLGYYLNKPIIALISEKEEIILDYYTYQQIFIWNRGV